MTEYEQILASRMALQKELESGGVVDLSGAMEDGVGEEAIAKSRYGGEMPSGQQPQSSTASKIGSGVTAAGVAGANPYVAGAGLALQTVGAVDDAHRQAEQAKIDAYNKKIMAERSAIRNFFA